jgi:phosphoglycerol transferase MdoB-like AlkP superfamily enzyme
MKNKLILRIVLDIILFSSAMTPAWWIIFPLGIVCVWYYKKFFEFPLAAFAFDVIYSAPRDKFFGFEYIYSSIALILFIIILILKSKIRRNLWQKSF